MLFLVAGGDQVDAGKTTFSVGLIERTGAVGYKPRAGNDFWFDHDDCLDALADGRLYGKDARKLAAAERADRSPEVLNPVHRLWRPAPDKGSGLLGRKDREFVLDRISRPTDEGPLYVHNGTADIPSMVAESLPLSASRTVETVAELNDLVEREYVPAFDSLANEIENAELAVLESYGDIAVPLETLSGDAIAAVAVVEPGRVRVYDGIRYARACSNTRSSPRDGQLEKRVPDVVGSLEPARTVSLPPLSKSQRDDPGAIAAAYEPAYDAVLETAAERG